MASKSSREDLFQIDTAFSALADNAKRALELFRAGKEHGARWYLEEARQSESVARELWQELGDPPPLEKARRYVIKERI